MTVILKIDLNYNTRTLKIDLNQVKLPRKSIRTKDENSENRFELMTLPRKSIRTNESTLKIDFELITVLWKSIWTRWQYSEKSIWTNERELWKTIWTNEHYPENRFEPPYENSENRFEIMTVFWKQIWTDASDLKSIRTNESTLKIDLN